jgi:hypothetical protein
MTESLCVDSRGQGIGFNPRTAIGVHQQDTKLGPNGHDLRTLGVLGVLGGSILVSGIRGMGFEDSRILGIEDSMAGVPT